MSRLRASQARWARGTLGAAVALAAVAAFPTGRSGAEPIAGSAGTRTALPDTESAVTVHGSGPFEDLEITVNQTANLGNQAISITWTGGEPTVRAGGVDFAEQFLQIMQCWTEPDASEPVPEQCEFGATDGVYGGRNQTLFAGAGFADERVISRGDFENFDPDHGVFEETTNWLWMPFHSVTGEDVGAHIDTEFSPAVESGNYWLNPLFNSITTNEIAGARTRPDGTGEELFEVVTGLESSGLGCGQAVLGDGDEREIPRCWLVIVPRGAAADENEGTIDAVEWSGAPSIMTSPLAPAAWEHRIAVPLEFNPVDTPCELNEDERRIVGSELVLRAVTSWQPALCAAAGLPPYSYTSVGDSSARLQVSTGASGAPGMAVVSRPLSPETASEANPVVYAPLTLSSIVIGFNVERIPEINADAEEQFRGVRIARLNLTPRLVAKLLTQSYQSQVRVGNADPADADEYEWLEDNPRHLDEDEDFLRFNPEFEVLRPLNTKNMAGLVLAAGTSDAARQVWEWILADPEARAWLDGEPDEWGMAVNPVYATTAEANSAGVPFGDPVPESFPKSDPNCFQAPAQGPAGAVVPPVLCGTDWLPYAENFRDAAQKTRAANDGARTTIDTEAITPERVWRPDGPQRIGTRSILSLVDSPTAAQYGVQAARLSRAGDDGEDREFIAPNEEGMLAAVDAMAPSDDSVVLVPDPLEQPADAYPLTILTYGAVFPLSLDEQAREEYAAFIDYAVGDGQVSGLDIGQLPPGYTELPESLQDQATEAATAIRELTAPTDEETATTITTVPVVPPTTNGVSPVTAAPRSTARSAPTTTPPPISVVEPPPPAVVPELEPPAIERGSTPISSIGGGRFVLPVLGALVLASMLGALEITKRPRRARPAPRPASTAAVLCVVTASTVLGGVVTASHAAAEPVDVGDLGVVAPDGGSLDRGGSTTVFTLEPSGDAECPGDSANDNYRLYSFMVPVATAASELTFDGLGPTPQVYERYEDFRMPLYGTDTRDYAAGFTAEQDEPGGPGAIIDIPTLSFQVYRSGELPFGEYRVGLACILLNEMIRYWDTEIVVSADPADPAGFQWRVDASAEAPSTSSTGVLVIGAGVALVSVLAVVRFRSRARTRSPLEMR